jgi:hypothetical protein
MLNMAGAGGAPHGKRQRNGGPRAVEDDRKSIYTGTRLSRAEHAKAHGAAAAAGVSLSGYLAELVRRDELDAEGRPLWAEPRPEELPLTEQRSA